MAVHVGDVGMADTRLQPQGFVRVNGERLDARAEFGLIEPGCEVVIVTGDHMGVVVRQRETGQPKLPNHGKRLCTSFDERVDEQAERAERSRQAWLARHIRDGTSIAGGVGALCAGIAAARLWDVLAELSSSPWAVATLVVVGGAVIGIGFFRGLDEALGQVDPNFRRVATPSTVLAILGLCGGTVLAIPHLGLATGLFIGLAAAILLAAVPVVFIVLTGSGGGG